MKKKLFPLALTFVFALFVSSCSSNDDPDIPGENANTETNDNILAVMQKNYYWNVPSNPNKTLDPTAFFASLLNSADQYTMNGKKYQYSGIYSNTAISGVSYDIGFEYTANVYDDGKVLYVIDYVKPGTPAEAEDLKRGFLIKSVGEEVVSASNMYDLLPNAIRNSGGNALKLDIANPETNLYLDYSIKPVTDYKENPVYDSQIIDVAGKKLGYLVYNSFNTSYDTQLKAALSSFADVNYLVLDLRYNNGGGQTPAQILGSAIVTDKGNDPLMMVETRADLENISVPFLTDINQLSNLTKVYVIIGQNTIGISEVLTNALKPYLGSKLAIVGQPSQGRNMSVGSTNAVEPYIMNIVLGKWTDKNLSSFGPIQPTISVEEPAILQPLGSTKEAMLAAIISDITGQSAQRSISTKNYRSINSSVLQKSTSVENVANFDLDALK